MCALTPRNLTQESISLQRGCMQSWKKNIEVEFLITLFRYIVFAVVQKLRHSEVCEFDVGGVVTYENIASRDVSMNAVQGLDVLHRISNLQTKQTLEINPDAEQLEWYYKYKLL